MTNREHPEEIEARELVERSTGLKFVHADRNGEVDYLTNDLGAALEVTTVTDGAAKGASKASGPLMSDPTPSTLLGECWMVTVDAGHDRFRGLPARVAPALAVLATAGIVEFWDHQAYARIFERDPLTHAMRDLLRERVQHASVLSEYCGRLPHGHQHGILLATVAGGSSGGSDAALALIEEDLNSHPDNYRKLRTAEVTETHLFVWLDAHTPFSIARPLERMRESDEMPHFLLPTRPPLLAALVDHLWIVHRSSRRGWHWEGSKWSAIEPSTPRPGVEKTST